MARQLLQANPGICADREEGLVNKIIRGYAQGNAPMPNAPLPPGGSASPSASPGPPGSPCVPRAQLSAAPDSLARRAADGLGSAGEHRFQTVSMLQMLGEAGISAARGEGHCAPPASQTQVCDVCGTLSSQQSVEPQGHYSTVDTCRPTVL
ncbi:hypothetical protein SKAU_G00122320 [Synaphobranchus kaupii]|uniref:Uncharacterized protein n=1 Tax=Synaphobranchus kaupii TaxID=118154 RepID=A0A9Q1FNR8_SYNKA|nr:hypothetical protein SKAU_G00122320 [Synaphobranchus kaupii]